MVSVRLELAMGAMLTLQKENENGEGRSVIPLCVKEQQSGPSLIHSDATAYYYSTVYCTLKPFLFSWCFVFWPSAEYEGYPLTNPPVLRP